MTYKKKCEQCTTEFNTERSDAKYCSGACRSKFNRTDIKRTDEIEVKRTVTKPADFTRAMVEANLAKGETFIPNWYTIGQPSRNAYKEAAGWNRLMK